MDSFFDIKGNEVSREGIVNEFINNYSGSLTDFNEGSEIRNLLEAFSVYAMGLEERLNDTVYVMDIMNADGEYLDILASQPQINMERIEGEPATGAVLFTIQTALLEELLIPEGTVVTSDTGVDFETVTDNYILPGETSRECMVEAIEVGTEGNIAANTILTKVDGYDAVDGFTVSNPNPFYGGLDYEEDDAFRDRIIEHMSLAKFGSKPYYISMLANEFPDAHDIYMDTSYSGYTAQVIPNSYAGSTAQTKLVQEVTAYLSDENNIMMGHNFYVQSPTTKTINILFTSEVSSYTGIYIALSSYDASTINPIKELLDSYFAGGSVSFAPLEFKGFNIKEEFNQLELDTLLKETFSSVSNVVFNNTPETLSSSQHKYKLEYR